MELLDGTVTVLTDSCSEKHEALATNHHKTSGSARRGVGPSSQTNGTGRPVPFRSRVTDMGH